MSFGAQTHLNGMFGSIKRGLPQKLESRLAKLTVPTQQPTENRIDNKYWAALPHVWFPKYENYWKIAKPALTKAPEVSKLSLSNLVHVRRTIWSMPSW